MSDKIRILSEDIVNKIAAGEVVERPASVVKELVENSIDANSTNIVVEIKAGGRRLIRVVDNGIGMDSEDAVTSLSRHATSKISSVKDLDAITTLGFRGEAIPSIAAVSKMNILTRTGNQTIGTSVRVHGGKIIEVTERGAPVGTTVYVEDIFFNTPARLKFLKTIGTETRNIMDIITKLAIAYPSISFKLIHNNRELLNLTRTKNLKERLISIMGTNLVNNMINLEFRKETITIYGFIGKPEIARNIRSYQLFFVNNRPITHRNLMHAVYSGYKHLIGANRHPIFVLLININPELIDVNVHPTKNEIRFMNEVFIYDLIVQALQNCLKTPEIVPQFSKPAEISINNQQPTPSKIIHERKQEIKKAIGVFLEKNKMVTGTVTSTDHKPTKPVLPVTEPKEPIEIQLFEDELRLIGQLHNSYICVQSKNELIIFDQHAAHERILFENAMDNLRGSPAVSQQLLFPLTLELTATELSIVEEFLDLFSKLGFKLGLFGGRTVIIEALPPVIKKWNEGQILHEILDELNRLERSQSQQVEELAKTFACKAAIKSGEPLTTEEMNTLIKNLFVTKMPYCCPHGRPTIIKIPIDDIARRFRR